MNNRTEQLSDDQWAERYQRLGDNLRKHYSDMKAEAYQQGYDAGFCAGKSSEGPVIGADQ